jgi:hypothetical protein
VRDAPVSVDAGVSEEDEHKICGEPLPPSEIQRMICASAIISRREINGIVELSLDVTAFSVNQARS